MVIGQNNLQKRHFGNTDMHITPVGFGAWALGGGDWVYAWGPQDDSESIAAIHHAIDQGINWIDTAAGYGLGHSEEVVGQALSGMSERPYVFTKCSLPWNEKGEIISSLKRDSVRRECEDSLRRLKIDAIDLYQIHWPRPEEDLEEGWSTLAELQREGKVRWIGVSNYSVGSDAPGGRDSAHQLTTAALFTHSSRSGAGDPSLLPGAQYRCDRLFTHVLWLAHRKNVCRTN